MQLFQIQGQKETRIHYIYYSSHKEMRDCSKAPNISWVNKLPSVLEKWKRRTCHCYRGFPSIGNLLDSILLKPSKSQEEAQLFSFVWGRFYVEEHSNSETVEFINKYMTWEICLSLSAHGKGTLCFLHFYGKETMMSLDELKQDLVPLSGTTNWTFNNHFVVFWSRFLPHSKMFLFNQASASHI